MADTPYNPLDKIHLGTSITSTLLAKELVPLGNVEPFGGAGIYAIYYRGAFAAYAETVEKHVPIYVGKAVPSGGRRGRVGLEVPTGPVLHQRLVEHADTIRSVENLRIEDFDCRYLVVDDVWIPLGESILIQHFQPVWNQELAGFGNHDPGRGRYKQQRSAWDTVHPGRAWAMRCIENRNTAEILARYGGTTRGTTE